VDLLRKIWARWKAFGLFLGNIVARVVLSIFYFTVFVPFGLGTRWFSDPLQVKTESHPLWRPRSTGEPTLDEAGRQF
jgi:hypothetical protein